MSVHHNSFVHKVLTKTEEVMANKYNVVFLCFYTIRVYMAIVYCYTNIKFLIFMFCGPQIVFIVKLNCVFRGWCPYSCCTQRRHYVSLPLLLSFPSSIFF